MVDTSCRTPDYDLQAAIEYNPESIKGRFGTNDIKHVHAAIAGENDEYEWYWIVELNDGAFLLINAGCDYTRWD